MILFTCLLVFAIALAALTIIIGGGPVIIVFGDIIVCVLMIAWIIKIAKKKK